MYYFTVRYVDSFMSLDKPSILEHPWDKLSPKYSYKQSSVHARPFICLTVRYVDSYMSLDKPSILKHPWDKLSPKYFDKLASVHARLFPHHLD